MNDSKTIEKLVEIGMTGREAKLYIAMLDRQEVTAAELHRLSGVLRSKIYETLEQMVSRGYCIERFSGKQRHFRAIRPAFLLEALKKHWLNNVEKRNQKADDVFGSLDKNFQERDETDSSLDPVEVIHNSNHKEMKFLDLLDQVKNEILCFSRSPYHAIDPKSREDQKRSHLALFKRGVLTRSIYMMEKESLPFISQMIQDLEEADQEVRIAKYIPIKMFIFDRKIVLLHLKSTPGQSMENFSWVIIEDPGFSSACMMLFEAVWEKSQTFQESVNKILVT